MICGVPAFSIYQIVGMIKKIAPFFHVGNDEGAIS